MKQTKSLSGARLLRVLVAMIMVLALLVMCACNAKDETQGEGDGFLLGDGDGKMEAQDVVDGATTIYGNLLTALGGEISTSTGSEMNISVSLGETILTQFGGLLESNGLGSDASWLSEIGLAVGMIRNNDRMKMGVAASLGGETLLSADVVMDMVGNMMYVAIPELNSQYIGQEVDFSQMIGSYQPMISQLEQYTDAVDALPTEAELNALLTRYLNVLLDNLSDPTTASETLSYGDLSQEVTATTHTIRRSDVLNIAEQVLKTAQADKELEAMLDKLNQWYNEQGAAQAQENGYTWYDVDLHNELITLIDPALQSITEAREQLEDADMLSLSVYIVGEEQVGFRLAMYSGYEAIEMYSYSLTNGENTAFVMDLMGSMKLSGTGTNVKNIANGTYRLEAQGTSLMTIEVKDFDTRALKKGELKGTLRLHPSEEILENMDGMVSMVSDPVVELGLNVGNDSSVISCKLYASNTFLVGLTISSRTVSGVPIRVPAEYVSMENSADMQNWVMAADYENVLNKMLKAGVPAELVEQLGEAIENMLG